MTQVEAGLPYQIFSGVSAVSAVAAAVAAVAEGNYIGANATITISNNGNLTTIISPGGITIGGDQRLELCVFYKYSGATFNVAQANICWYQRLDAFDNRSINLPFIILKPGERLSIRVFNRAPAVAANITASVNFFQVEERVYDQYISKQRKMMEDFGGVF